MVAISAHRGGGENAAAGSWAAYESAVALGVDYVEFDVARTRDGHLVVYHDLRAEIRGVYPRHVNRADLETFSVEELLHLISGRTKAHIDIKASGYERELVTLVMSILGDPTTFVVTGGDETVAAVKAAEPAIRTALSVGRGWHEVRWSQTFQTRWSELRPVPRVRACGADGVAVHHRLARLGVLDQCRREGLGPMVWTVNKPDLIQTFLGDHRVDVLITERPGLAARMAARTSHDVS